MLYLLIAVSIVWIGFFLWASADSRKRSEEYSKKAYKPQFRSEKDLEEYGKPIGVDPNPVDFDDAE
jgi:hypothetical protein